MIEIEDAVVVIPEEIVVVIPAYCADSLPSSLPLLLPPFEEYPKGCT